jgi:hypothetical protein
VSDCGCTNFPAALGPVTIGDTLGIGMVSPAVPQALAHLQGTGALLIFDDNTQTGAAGYWRLAVAGGALELDENTAAGRDFSSFRGVLRTDKQGTLELGGSSAGGTARPTL